jgi:hypothetical protein
VALMPDREVGAVARDVLDAVRQFGQEVSWTVALDEDDEHATYDPDQVGTYFAAATEAALVLAAFRAPYRGRSTPVNDFIMRNAMNTEEVAVGWWAGDERYGRPAYCAYAHPAPPGFADARLEPSAARWGAFPTRLQVRRVGRGPARERRGNAPTDRLIHEVARAVPRL